MYFSAIAYIKLSVKLDGIVNTLLLRVGDMYLGIVLNLGFKIK